MCAQPMALIDTVLPRFQFREFHVRRVAASPAAARAALDDIDLGGSPVIATLFRLRGLRAGPLSSFLAQAFRPLLDAGERGLVVGSIGAFWRPAGGIVPFEPADFAANRAPGAARLAWSFEFSPAAGGCTVTTETRIACNDRRALACMWPYWLLIRPASGLIRREILRLLDAHADCSA
jgi:hypothetical protein